jgi:hypothetical protein
MVATFCSTGMKKINPCKGTFTLGSKEYESPWIKSMNLLGSKEYESPWIKSMNLLGSK